MAPAELLAKARALIASDKVKPLAGVGVPALEALQSVAGADAEALAQALELLDSVTPRPFTFLLWVDGAEAVLEGESAGFVYRYDRPKAEVLAVMGRACIKAARSLAERAKPEEAA
jgi:hypothetical protein